MSEVGMKMTEVGMKIIRAGIRNGHGGMRNGCPGLTGCTFSPIHKFIRDSSPHVRFSSPGVTRKTFFCGGEGNRLLGEGIRLPGDGI